MNEFKYTLPNGGELNIVTPEQAEAKHYLTKDLLDKLHLMPTGKPCACRLDENQQLILYYNANDVKEAPIESWYQVEKPTGKTRKTEDGREVPVISFRRATANKYYPLETIHAMGYDEIGGPVACFETKKGGIIWFYDKKTAIARPKLCDVCRTNPVFQKKMCLECYKKSIAEEKALDDARRNQPYHQHRAKTIFFDLELTGVYQYDEILSVSIADGNGKMLMNTLVKPRVRRRWKETEKIHGITPEMVKDAPYLSEIEEEIKRIFEGAEAILAYGILTDYTHIKEIYDTNAEKKALWSKCKCIYQEYVKYQRQTNPENAHFSLKDAMAQFEIGWEGTAHNSDADTLACAKVWERMFPNYYED